VVRCPGYGQGLQTAVEELLAPLGGIGAFVRPGQSVLIKPNLLSDRNPAEGVTTHPGLVAALIALVKGAGGKPCVADSPANTSKLERVWERTGFRALCEEENVPLLSLEQEGSTVFDVDGYRFSIARPVLDADVVISVPKVKTHVLTTLTGAVKNTYGAVPGYQKTQLHRDHPRAGDFGELLLRIHDKVAPRLSLADGIVGMQGDGPSGGEPAQLGFLAASGDAVALDFVLCRILGIKPRAVPTLAALDSSRLADIQTIGVPVEQLRPPAFRLPGTLRARLIPGWLVRLLGPLFWIRPEISDDCISCGRCAKACPADALSLKASQTDDPRKPLLDGPACIGCCCCHEVCPESAITMAPSPLLRILRGGKPL